MFEWLDGMNLLSDHEGAEFGLQGQYCTSLGEALDPDLVQDFLNIMLDIKMSMFKLGQIDSYESAKQVFKQQFELKLKSVPGSFKNETQLRALFDWFLRYETIENGCDTMSEVSMASYTDWTDFCDGATLNFRYGYRTLLDWFCSRIPTERILHMRKEVTNIEMMTKDSYLGYPKGPVVIRYLDSISRSAGEIECSAVIVTSSIGFLQQHMKTLFTPPLPVAKRRLIKRMGFGTVNKIFLKFERPFWNKQNEDSIGIKLIWREEDNRGKFPIWARDIISFEAVRRQPNILVGWIGGYGARLMEQDSDTYIGQTCIRILKQFLPIESHELGKLLTCFATRWHSNPFTCGSYSFRSMSSIDDDIDLLHEPICMLDGEINTISPDRKPMLMFAGEATAGKLYSTTHGAIISGWREADRFLTSNHHV